MTGPEALQAAVRFVLIMILLAGGFILLHIAAVLPVLVLGW
jgi:hypothetical protein